MTIYTGPQIRDACVKAGFSTAASVNVGGHMYAPADVMAAIALAESGGDTQATANTSKEYSVGVFQENLKAHPDLTEADGRDLNASAAFAYRLYQGRGGDWLDWTMYKNGEYKHFLPLADAPVGASAGANDPKNNPPAVQPGTQQAATIFGITPPTPAEWQKAGLLLFTAMTGIFLIVVGVGAWVKEPVATVVKAVA